MNNDPNYSRNSLFPRFNLKSLGVGALVLILACVLCAAFAIPRVFDGGDDDNEPRPAEQEDDSPSVSDESRPENDNVVLGSLTTAASLDSDGCPVEVASTFSPTDSIYVVAPNSDVPEGTLVFARLHHNGNAVEDSPEIQADQDYSNTCINFVFEPTTGEAFEPGSYEVEFIVNGNPSESVTFEVR